jgi:hypothetical protein
LVKNYCRIANFSGKCALKNALSMPIAESRSNQKINWDAVNQIIWKFKLLTKENLNNIKWRGGQQATVLRMYIFNPKEQRVPKI